MKSWLFAILVLSAVAIWGCSSAQYQPASSPPSPSVSAQADCERGSGVWQADLASCKYPAPQRRVTEAARAWARRNLGLGPVVRSAA